MDLNIKNAHLFYEDLVDSKNKQINNDNGCNCIDIPCVADIQHYYMVCSGCGNVNGYVNELTISYNESKYLRYRQRRSYKKSAYLRLKINQLFKNPLPVLPEHMINQLSKKANQDITSIIRFMKKKKIIKKYDPLKSLYRIKNIEPLQMTDGMLSKLIQTFCSKIKVYTQNNYKRINYNFIILKIFEEWNITDISQCFKLLQDSKIMKRNEEDYSKLFGSV